MMKQLLPMRRVVGAVLVLLATFAGNLVQAQGLTTSSMNGLVTDDKGETLPGATVIAIHDESGTKYGTTTQANGRFNINGMRVGTYTVTVSFVGQRDEKVPNISLTLGNAYNLATVILRDASSQLQEVVISARKNDMMSSGRTGASSNFRKEQFDRLPSISRSFTDFSSLTPQAGAGFSFGGRSQLYNNFSIDGATSNNVFGLSALPGGQSGSTPISIDAIEEMTVSVAPYDVRQGAFTGAGVNAVTRSGTNKIQGSVYGFFRNQSLTGSKIEGIESTPADFSSQNYGFRLGGPLVKNKLFFFTNFEQEKQINPAVNFPADGTTSGRPNQPTAAVLDDLRQFLISRFNFDPGTYNNFDVPTESRKFLVKLDWNINTNNKFSVRYNQMESFRDIPPSSSGGIGSSPTGGRTNNPNTLPFSSSWYRINNNLKSIIAELNTNVGNKFSNKVQVGYTAFRDFRQNAGGLPVPSFPLVDILGPNGQTLTSFGPDPFTPNNRLDQDVFQFNDDFTVYAGNHTLAFGTANEFYKFTNVFTQQINGVYQYNSIGDFKGNVDAPSLVNSPTQYLLQYSALKDTPAPGAIWRANQFGFYAQDEYSGIKNMKLTFGVRVDIPTFPDKPVANEDLKSLYFNGEQLDVGKLPDPKLYWSPRLGFNWDAMGDKSLQFRGGTGVFTGKIPFVWVSNQFSNTGLLFGTIINTSQTANNNAGVRFNPDPKAYVPSLNNVQPGFPATSSYSVNVTTPKFRFPQVWRSNFAVDKTLPGDVVVSLEGIYTKDLNAIFIRDANLSTPVGFLNGDGREIYAGVSGNTAVTAPFDRRYNDRITQALVLDNVNKGYSWSLTGQVKKQFSNGFQAELAYTYTDSRDVNGASGSTANSVFTSSPVINNPNMPSMSHSANLTRHRIIGNASYRIEWNKNLASNFSLIYRSNSGDLFSYVYGGSPNSDGINNNDLMYVPRNRGEILLTTTNANDTRTTAQIWDQLDQYINADPYLSANRGNYVVRNGAEAPWYHLVNFRFLQDIGVMTGKSKNTLQFSVDITNLPNLLNSNWGILRVPVRSALLQFVGYENAHGTVIGTAPNQTTTVATGRPIYSFAANSDGSGLTQPFVTSQGLGSRYQIQVGLRYNFN